jgi:hypothetical protein
MAALLAGIGAERLWRSGTRQSRIACIALVTLAAVEYAVWPPAMWRDVLPTMAHRWVVAEPDNRALDCTPLTPESESIPWLSGYRVSLRRGWFDDCAEPNIAAKLSASGYTHLLVRRDGSEARWFAGHRIPDGLRRVEDFPGAQVFAVTAPTPLVYTAQMRTFYSREYDESWTWRWMRPGASWIIVNRNDHPMVAAADVELTAFHGTRRVRIRLDGADVQTITVPERRGLDRIGPLLLTSGDHVLAFDAIEAATVADHIMHNGDDRPLSVAFGAWQWVVAGDRP